MLESTENLLELLDEHGARLHALLVKMTLHDDVAADFLQELFLRLSKSDGFQRAPRPERYLFRAAINLAFDWRKRERSQEIRVWIDPDTKLPVYSQHIAKRKTNRPATQPSRLIANSSNFQYDVALQDALFDLTPPEVSHCLLPRQLQRRND